jgi:hypothetical protein
MARLPQAARSLSPRTAAMGAHSRQNSSTDRLQSAWGRFAYVGDGSAAIAVIYLTRLAVYYVPVSRQLAWTNWYLH